MPKLDSSIKFTGAIGDFSVYKMRGVEGYILRLRNGPSREQIENDEAFVKTRKINREFAGRSKASKWIMQMLQPLKPLASYNIAGPLNRLVKPAQEADTESEFGKRRVLLTSTPGLLDGFSLNNELNFESIVRAPVTCTLSRETLSAEVSIPALKPGINFKPHAKHQLYSFQVVLGAVPDLFFDNYISKSLPNIGIEPVLAESKWFSSLEGSEAQKFELKHSVKPQGESFTLMVAIGIRYGAIAGADKIVQVKYAGAAKIIKTV